MPILDHPSFDLPIDDAEKVWRFTDLLKLVFTLNNSALFFTSLKNMGFSDPYEGMLPKGNYAHRGWKSVQDVPERTRVHISKIFNDTDSFEDALNKYKNMSEHVIRSLENGREWICVNCWHMNGHESAAMWRLYCEKGFGVAIVSTIGRIKRAFEKNDKTLYLGKIQYRDYENFFLNDGNLYNPAQFKRISFSHENEIRIVCGSPGDKRQGVRPDFPGVALECDLSELIEKIVVSPHEEVWIFEEIKKLIHHYLPDVEVVHSELMNPRSM